MAIYDRKVIFPRIPYPYSRLRLIVNFQNTQLDLFVDEITWVENSLAAYLCIVYAGNDI